MKYIHYKYNLFLPLMVWILAVACNEEDDPQPADSKQLKIRELQTEK